MLLPGAEQEGTLSRQDQEMSTWILTPLACSLHSRQRYGIPLGVWRGKDGILSRH